MSHSILESLFVSALFGPPFIRKNSLQKVL